VEHSKKVFNVAFLTKNQPAEPLYTFCTNPVAYALVVPALRQEREGRGTLCVGVASEIKSLGHPPKTA
jgi:hypothetical protein